MKKKVQIIAEVKTQSPFPSISNGDTKSAWKSDKSWDELFAVANEIGDMISIHTDARWGGSFELLKKARGMTDKLILAKGIHADDADVKRALDAGADFVLIVGRIPAGFDKKTMKRFLIEPVSIAELKKIPVDMRAVWNSRDLKTGGLKADLKAGKSGETFALARDAFDGWLCQASNIRTIADIAEGADAVLVGTHLFKFAESLLNK